MKRLLISCLFALALSCSSGSSNCTKGSTTSCACTDGRQGAQMCLADGTLGQCVCTGGTGTGGSNGAGGAGGSATGSGGSGGRGGAGGSATGAGGQGTGGTGSGTGGAGGQSPYTGMFTISYSGGPTKNVSTCYYCTAVYTASSGEGDLSYGYSAGATGVSISIRPAKTGGGYEVAPAFGDNDTSLPARLRGSYLLAPNSWVPLTGSCVNLTQLDLRNGGTVAGSLNCTLQGGNDTTPVQATLQGTFQSTFPP